MSALIPSDFTISVSNENTLVSNLSEWSFPDTPQNFREQILGHTRDRIFTGARVRTVAPYTIADAEAIFRGMADDDVEVSKTFPIKGDVLSLCDKSVTLRLNRDVQGTTVQKASIRNPFPRKSIVPLGCKYAVLVGVLVKYRPLTPLFAKTARVELSLVDTGLALGETSPTVSFSKNVGANILMGLSHPVQVGRLERLLFKIETSSTGVLAGEAWATMELVFNFRFSSKPLTLAMTPSVVQYELTSDIFEIRARDPRVFRAELEQDDLDLLKMISSDIPGLDTSPLNAYGRLYRKPGRAVAADSAAAGGSSVDPPADWLRSDPFALAAVPVAAPVSRTPQRPTTADLDEAVARLAEMQAAYNRHKPTPQVLEPIREVSTGGSDKSAQRSDPFRTPVPSIPPSAASGRSFWPVGPLSVDGPLSSGLAAVITAATGIPWPDDLLIVNGAESALRAAVLSSPGVGTIVHVFVEPEHFRGRLATHAFTSSMAMALSAVFLAFGDYEFRPL